MGTGSFERGDQPRSVSDPDSEAYEEMIRRSRALADRRFDDAGGNGPAPDVGHPGPAESLIPIWGSGREALADLHDGNDVGAAFNALLAGSDLFLAKDVLTGVLKGGLKIGGSFAWRNAPWEAQGVRQWLGEKGFLAKGQPGHHWAFEQASKVPGWIKHQPPFVRGMVDAADHGRIHGPYKGLPQYNALQRIWRGTPDWWKAANVSTPAHAGVAAGLAVDEQK